MNIPCKITTNWQYRKKSFQFFQSFTDHCRRSRTFENPRRLIGSARSTVKSEEEESAALQAYLVISRAESVAGQTSLREIIKCNPRCTDRNKCIETLLRPPFIFPSTSRDLGTRGTRVGAAKPDEHPASFYLFWTTCGTRLDVQQMQRVQRAEHR